MLARFVARGLISCGFLCDEMRITVPQRMHTEERNDASFFSVVEIENRRFEQRTRGKRCIFAGLCAPANWAAWYNLAIRPRASACMGGQAGL